LIRFDWRDLAWLIGFILGWLLSQLYPTPARASGYDDVAVRIENRIGSVASVGSGTLAAGDGQRALVITCKHLFRDGRGVLTVERPDHRRYPGRLLGLSSVNDIAAVEIPDPGVRTLRIASQQAPAATLIGWGSTNRPWKHRGRLIEQTGRTVFYAFNPLEGDSGGGVFDDSGAFVGVAWGTDGESGAVVPLADLRRALAGAACSKYFRPTTSTAKAGNPMFPLILAAGMMGQLPPMPDKSPPQATQPIAPSKTLPSPQARATPQATPMPAFVPAQQYEAVPQVELAQAPIDIPITFRVRIRPQIDVQADAYAPAPRAQAYAAPQVSYGGGGCYGGSYSAGGYGYSSGFAAQAYAAPAAAVICPSGVCYGGGFGLASRPFGRKIKIKEGPGIGLGPRGLRELLGR
jgi:hypothetical protein